MATQLISSANHVPTEPFLKLEKLVNHVLPTHIQRKVQQSVCDAHVGQRSIQCRVCVKHVQLEHIPPIPPIPVLHVHMEPTLLLDHVNA